MRLVVVLRRFFYFGIMWCSCRRFFPLAVVLIVVTLHRVFISSCSSVAMNGVFSTGVISIGVPAMCSRHPWLRTFECRREDVLLYCCRDRSAACMHPDGFDPSLIIPPLLCDRASGPLTFAPRRPRSSASRWATWGCSATSSSATPPVS